MSPQYTYSDGTTPSVCIIGAGLAGLCAGIQLKKQLGMTTFTILEKNHDIGGVWLTNTYPGCGSEVPSQMYSYSFEQNPSWTEFMASREEIWNYIQRIAKKYELYPKIQFNTMVKSMYWEESKKGWKVTTTTSVKDEKPVEELQLREFDIVIIGTGPFRAPHIPHEFKSFTGPIMHSAEWNSNINLENKIVGVVGSGASAVQIVPAIASKTKELIVYQRTPPYIFPRLQHQIPGIFKLLYTIFPFLLWFSRAIIFVISEVMGLTYNIGSFMNLFARQICRCWIYWNIKDKHLRRRFVPTYKFGIKLFLSSDKYYKTFNEPNVTLNTSNISKVHETEIINEDGCRNKLDVLILCTGFKVQDFFALIEVVGKNGVDILKLWKSDRPRMYYGIVCNAAPNLFFLLGPNTVLVHTSTIFSIECQTTFIVNALREMMKRNACSIQVKLTAQDDCMKKEILIKATKKVFEIEEGNSWLTNDDGNLTTAWPKTSTNYWRKTRTTDYSKFDFGYK